MQELKIVLSSALASNATAKKQHCSTNCLLFSDQGQVRTVLISSLYEILSRQSANQQQCTLVYRETVTAADGG